MPKIPQEQQRRYEIYNESCFDTFKRLESGSVDMILCDPPYGTTACKWDSVIPLTRMWMELKRVIKRNAAVVLTSCQPFTSRLIASNYDFYCYDYCWTKSKMSGVLNAKREPLRQHENIIVFGSSPVYFPQGLIPIHAPVTEPPRASMSSQNYGRVGDSYYTQRVRNYPTSVLAIPSQGKTEHPTQKPVALMEYLIKTYTKENDLVLDFAMGSGTTGVACGNLGRRFVGCDNDTEFGYFDIATRRIREAYGN